jgi:hypothetical protein
MRARVSAVFFGLFTISSVLGVVGSATAATAFSPDDVFVGVGSNKVQWRSPGGTLNQTLTTAASSSITTGMAFDPAGKLYVTGYTSNVVNRFTTSGAADTTFGSGYNSHPESIAFDRAGNAYVGQERGARDILKFGPSGNLLASYNASTEAANGTDRIDLAPDQCTIYYTSQGKSVRRFNVCTNSQGPNLTSSLPGKEAFDVKVLPTGGVLVADTTAVYRLNASGTITQTYDQPNRDCWVTLALDSAATSFWAADRCASQVYRFSLTTGTVQSSFTTGTKSGSINGLAVSGGATAARSAADLSVSVTDSPDPAVGNGQVHYLTAVNNAGPAEATGIALAFSVSSGQVLAAGGTGWGCSLTGGQTASCTRQASVAPGSSAPAIDVTVRAPQATATITISGTATVSSASPDPDGGNNSDTEQTTLNPGSSANIPPEGGTISTNTGLCAAPSDPACADVTFPAGPGGFASVAELAPLNLCATFGPLVGPSFDVLPPNGYNDASNPIELLMVYDGSVAPESGGPGTVCAEKLVGGIFVTVLLPPCQPLGHAVPAPCVNSQSWNEEGDLEVVVLMLSADPKFQFVSGIGG